MVDTPKPFTPETLADRWGVSPNHVRKLIKSGELKHFKVGSLLRVTARAAIEYELRDAPPEMLAAALEELTAPYKPTSDDRYRQALKYARLVVQLLEPDESSKDKPWHRAKV